MSRRGAFSGLSDNALFGIFRAKTKSNPTNPVTIDDGINWAFLNAVRAAYERKLRKLREEIRDLKEPESGW